MNCRRCGHPDHVDRLCGRLPQVKIGAPVSDVALTCGCYGVSKEENEDELLRLDFILALRAWDHVVQQEKPLVEREAAKDRVVFAAKKVSARLARGGPDNLEELLREREDELRRLPR